jgi:uncharacterized membrane-anchored protein YhcB (DUF1043 family)
MDAFNNLDTKVQLAIALFIGIFIGFAAGEMITVKMWETSAIDYELQEAQAQDLLDRVKQTLAENQAERTEIELRIAENNRILAENQRILQQIQAYQAYQAYQGR